MSKVDQAELYKKAVQENQVRGEALDKEFGTLLEELKVVIPSLLKLARSKTSPSFLYPPEGVLLKSETMVINVFGLTYNFPALVVCP